MPQSIFLELPPEMQRRLPRSLVDVVKGQGVEIPPEISLTKGPMPASEDGVATKDWGIVLSIAENAGDIAALGTAAAAIIVAYSKFLSDRARDPKDYFVDDVEEVREPDGRVIRRQTTRVVRVESGPALEAELSARLEKGGDLAVKAEYRG